jgi:cobalamin biosynthetic protein CobC
MRTGGDGTAAINDHGGSLAGARTRFPGAPEPWIDLSTGINAHPYPLSPIPSTAFTRLPEPSEIDALATVAASYYGAPSAETVVSAPGTQILLPMVAALAPPGRAVVLGPTYAEHRRAAALAGHTVVETGDFGALDGADLAIVVNPNNPDGRRIRRADLLQLSSRVGLLVVDEAFMDPDPAESVAGSVAEHPIVVLRSFGKFFGLAGLRLGFAIAAPPLARKLADRLGPWAVSGPALAIGLQALTDRGWQAATRERLSKDADRLDVLLRRAGLTVAGGTSLFRFVHAENSEELFERLGRHGILVRRFAERPGVLRFGLPGGEADWQRLEGALS